MTKNDLDLNEYHKYYQTYIDRTGQKKLISGLMESFNETYQFLSNLNKEVLDYRYQPEKWTIKEVLQHLIDSERVFAYRALRIAREDKTPLPGFNQDDYILPSKATERSMDDLLNEYKFVRKSTDLLFKSFSHDVLLYTGVASNATISVRALGFIIIGHENHHCAIIKERYLN